MVDPTVNFAGADAMFDIGVGYRAEKARATHCAAAAGTIDGCNEIARPRRVAGNG